jgi:O-antigen/teichoic acid export membrane protein
VNRASYSTIFASASRLFSGGIINALLGIITMVITARFLGLAEFGFFVLAQTYVMIFGLVVSFQTWQPVAKFGGEYIEYNEYEKFDRMFSLAFLIDLLGAWVIGSLTLVILFFFHEKIGWDEEQFWVIASFMLAVLFNISGAFSGLLRLLDQYSLIARGQVYFGLIRLVLVCVAALTSSSVTEFALAWAVAEVFSHFYLVSKGLKSYKQKFGRGLRFVLPTYIEQKEFVSFTLANNIDVTIRMVSRQADIVLLGLLVGREEVGLYKIAVQICSLPLRIIDPIYQVLLPKFSQLLITDTTLEVRKMVAKLSGLGGLFFGFVYIVFIVVGQALINLAFGDQYAGVYEISSIYLIALSGAMIGFPYVPYFQALNKAALCMKIQLCSTLVYIASLYPLIYQLQTIGAAIGYIVYYFVWLSLALYFFRKIKI